MKARVGGEVKSPDPLCLQQSHGRARRGEDLIESDHRSNTYVPLEEMSADDPDTAHYFDLDPLLVRVAFVAALAFGGASLIAYVLLWWLVDPAPDGFFDEVAEPGAADAVDAAGADEAA